MIRRAGGEAVGLRILGEDRPWSVDPSLPHGESRLPCRRHPLGCVRFGPGVVLRERVGPRHARSQGRAARGSGPAQARAFLSGRLCPAKETAPEGADAGTTPAGPPGQRQDRHHDQDTRPDDREDHASPQPAGSITFELVARLAPHQGLVDNLVRTFGLDPIDYDGIRDAIGEHIAEAAKAFGTALNEKALQIHLQRITGAFVSSAFGAAQFYGTKKSAALELTSRLLNDDRDEDRDAPAGFENKAERARLFAAEMALQSFALMAAAEGAIAAYAEVTGEDWKPYEVPVAPAASVARKSAAVEMAAFEMAA